MRSAYSWHGPDRWITGSRSTRIPPQSRSQKSVGDSMDTPRDRARRRPNRGPQPGDIARIASRRAGVLVDGPRDVPDRHRTLRATIEWSHRRLDAPQRSVFAALGVFAGAPHRSAVIEVVDGTDVVATALTGLVRQSLLMMDTTGPEPRYPMLQIMRAFARERLAECGRESTTRRRHAEHYLGIAQAQVDLLHSSSQVEAFALLQRDRVEFDSALDWSARIHGDGGDNDLTLRLVGSLWDFWQSSGDVTVPLQRAVDALARDTSSDPTVRAAAASGAGTLCWLAGDLAAAIHWHSEALANYRLIGDGPGIAWSTSCLAVQEANAGKYGAADASPSDHSNSPWTRTPSGWWAPHTQC